MASPHQQYSAVRPAPATGSPVYSQVGRTHFLPGQPHLGGNETRRSHPEDAYLVVIIEEFKEENCWSDGKERAPCHPGRVC